MIFYDLIHGYQPFKLEGIIPEWVKRNLREVFLPTSLAMRKGLVKRGIQLQGWTINNWLNAPFPIKKLAKKTLNNLKISAQKKHIEIGTSAYSHPILPMLSDDLIRAQIILDREIVEKYLGKPTWFWPPEGAINQRVLKIIHEVVPDLILLLPDKAIKKYNFTQHLFQNSGVVESKSHKKGAIEKGSPSTTFVYKKGAGFSGPIKIKFPAQGWSASGEKNGFQRTIVFSCLFKDLFMNAEDYRHRPKYVYRPKHLPKELIWSQIRRLVHSPKVFLKTLDFLDKNKEIRGDVSNYHVLARDWENAGSKKGLRFYQVKPNKIRDVGNFLRLKDKIDFRLPSQFNWKKTEVIPISKITSCSWDMDSVPTDPFPWWLPNEHGEIWRHRKPFRRKRILEWQKLIQEYDQIFQQKIKAQGGLRKALKNKKFKNLLKKTLPALHSCVGWHYFAKRAWKPDYQYSQNAIKNIVLPSLDIIKKI